MDTVSTFNYVRDIPYKISIKWKDGNLSCIGKHDRLYDLLKSKGCKVRYRVCSFLWSSIKLPSKVKEKPHKDNCYHTYLEININGKWKVLDATWDSKLKNIFHINKWNGKTSTEISVKPIKIFSPEKSEAIVKKRNMKGFLKNREKNGQFFQSFNKWLEENRT